MPNLFQNTTSGAGDLKTIFEGPIREQLNDQTKFVKMSDRVTKPWSAKQINVPLNIARNQGIGSTTDGGALPAIGRQGLTQATIVAKYNYARTGITGAMIKSSMSDAGSFVRDFQYEMDRSIQDLSTDVDRQWAWNGDGKVASMGANAVATTSITIAGRETGEPAQKFVAANMQFDIYTSAGALVQSGITIQSITGDIMASTATAVVSTPVNASLGDYIVRSGSYGNDIQGILYSQDGLTTSIYGIDRSTTPQFQGNLVDAGGQQLTLSMLQSVYNRVPYRSGKPIDWISTEFSGIQMYQKLLTPDIRFVASGGSPNKGDGSFGQGTEYNMAFMGVGVEVIWTQSPKFLFLNKKSWKWYEMCPASFADESGAPAIAQPSTDAYEMRLRWFGNAFCDQPGANAVLKGYISP